MDTDLTSRIKQKLLVWDGYDNKASCCGIREPHDLYILIRRGIFEKEPVFRRRAFVLTEQIITEIQEYFFAKQFSYLIDSTISSRFCEFPILSFCDILSFVLVFLPLIGKQTIRFD